MDELPKRRRRKAGRSNLYRTEIVTIRLDPKLRYLTELAARKQRRTVSSFIEWTIENALRDVVLSETSEGQSLADAAEELWDIDEPDRVAKLAFKYPNLMTLNEQTWWKVAREIGYFWRGRFDSSGEWTWRVEPDELHLKRLRKHWEDVKKVATGEADESTFPQVPRRAPETSESVEHSAENQVTRAFYFEEDGKDA